MSARAASAVRAALVAALRAPPAGARVFVAYSGGADSTALLLAAAEVCREHQWPLRAFHFDHRLHPASAEWLSHCRARCAALEVPLDVEVATAPPPVNASVEAWAREVRYAAAARLLAPGDLMLTAHHRDDLAETLLLAALRGSGPHGLAGIAPSRPLAHGTLLRPLLELSRDCLRAAVVESNIGYLSDPANEDVRHDRSFLRHAILPLIAARWPAAADNFARAARLQRSVAQALDDDADRWLDRLGATTTQLPIAALAALDDDCATKYLRRWLRRAGGHAPDAGLLHSVLREAVHSRHDATPCLAWRGGELRRHRTTLYWLARPAQALTTTREWPACAPLQLPGGALHARATMGAGIRATLTGPYMVRPRSGGERLRPHGRLHTVMVKQLLQEAGVPPWERAQLPLIYVGERLVALADLAVAADAAAAPGEAGVVFDYLRD